MDTELNESNSHALPSDELGDETTVESLRNEMNQAAATDSHTEETAEAVEKILLQMIDQWCTDPTPSYTPTADDFGTVRSRE